MLEMIGPGGGVNVWHGANVVAHGHRSTQRWHSKESEVMLNRTDVHWTLTWAPDVPSLDVARAHCRRPAPRPARPAPEVPGQSARRRCCCQHQQAHHEKPGAALMMAWLHQIDWGTHHPRGRSAFESPCHTNHDMVQPGKTCPSMPSTCTMVPCPMLLDLGQ